MKLTKTTVDALTCPPGKRDILVFDDELTGFAVRVTAKGAKIFLLQYRHGTSVSRIRIGRYGDITTAQARSKAEQIRGLTVAGGDPVAERRARRKAEAEAATERKRAAAAEVLTFGKLVDDWSAMYLAHKRERYRTEATRALRSSLAELVPLPAHAINQERARTALDAIVRPKPAKAGKAGGKNGAKSTPPPASFTGATMARRVQSYARAAFSWAIKRGLVAHNPFLAIEVGGKDISRERVLSDVELGEIWAATGLLGWPWGPYFRFLLLTLQREAETAGLAWSELSPERDLWTLPGARAKNGKSHFVHLAAPAREILEAAPRIAGSPLVFTTTGETPISGFSHAKLRLDRKIAELRAKLSAAEGTEPADAIPWRIHDFRRTGVTVLVRLGIDWAISDKLLNHTTGAIGGTAKIYQRYEFMAERQAALERWAAHVVSLGEVQKYGKAP